MHLLTLGTPAEGVLAFLDELFASPR